MSIAITTPLNAQTRWFIEGRLGHKTGLGYQLPSSALGLHIEHRAIHWLVVQGFARYSPTNKLATRDGDSILLGTKALFIMNKHFALAVGVRRSELWTSKFNKATNIPSLGFAVAVGQTGRERFYFDYALPTGCQWATRQRPCRIQSNRTQGPEFAFEGWLAPRWQLGTVVGVYRFLDQANPLVQSARSSHTKATIEVYLRYRLA